MHARHLTVVLPLFAILLPAAPGVSATPPDQPSAAPTAPARTQRPTEATPKAGADATAVVDKQLVQPLTLKEAKQDRFSRAYVPPQARRVRILDDQPSTDGRGAAFVAFAVDARPRLLARKAADDADWRKDAIVGCVYPTRDEVFIKRGDKFFGAGLLLGRRTAPPDAAVCRPAAMGTHKSADAEAGPEVAVRRGAT